MSDGGATAVRALMNRLGVVASEVDQVSVHTLDLDDVFFALTGHPKHELEHETKHETEHETAEMENAR